jgi:hypothetical protein
VFSELGGYVQVQGSPRAGVSVATYTNGGLELTFKAELSGFSGILDLLPLLAGPHGYYVLRWINLTGPITGGIIVISDALGNVLEFVPGQPQAMDLGGLVVRNLEATCTAPTFAAPAFGITTRYDEIFAKPGIS